LHWAYFARRYKDVPNSHLSFNLLNEPADVDAKTYLLVVEKLAAAIRPKTPTDSSLPMDSLGTATMPGTGAPAYRSGHPRL
jgi:hypothetical protein